MATSAVKVLKNTAHAWVNSMPPGKPKLMVIVAVTTPTTGWTVKLVRANPQGINPAILLLRIDATPPKGRAGQMVTRHELRYEESPPKGKYTEATIIGGTPGVTVKVHQIA
ncbi:MAG TPA: hypothetical protein VNU97_04860 [Rhizomicrobium sp.]|jgi:hypothetical protein|nr:hypothetical protein [Rhizomicrobium sp.]